MHTSGDPAAPHRHTILYGFKVLATGSFGNCAHLPVSRYGHCANETTEVLAGFAPRAGRSAGALAASDEVLVTESERAAYRQLQQTYGDLRP